MMEENTDLKQILVAHDMRPSAQELVPAFIEGAISRGVDVISLGLCSTDMLYFASGYLDSPGAIFTASHNPSEYNGIKFCRAGAGPVGKETGLFEIRNRLDSESSQPTERIGSIHERNIIDAFVSHVLDFVDHKALLPLHVVADVANGMGGLVVPAVFKHLPISLDLMFGQLDGTFPNHPADPLNPENLVDLQKRVENVHADVGLAFDGDADRVFLIDELGQSLSGSTTTAIVARNILENEPGSTIIHNLICSRSVPEIIEKYGGTAIRSRVGHSYIKQMMAETDAAFAGEHSGHYYFRENYRADSGLIAALIVHQEMSVKKIPLSELRKECEKYPSTGEINFRVKSPELAIERIGKIFSGYEFDLLHGLTVSAQEWWFNLRPSNTEPLLRLNLEAETSEIMKGQLAALISYLEDFVQ